MIYLRYFLFILSTPILQTLVIQLMQQSRQSNTAGGYRIKRYRNNFLAETQNKDDEDAFKMSIHSSSQKSPGKGSSGKKRRNNSTANRNNDYQKFSYRSKKTNISRSNVSTNSLTGSHKKQVQQNNGHIKQFANVKQLLMIKAYDKKLFRKVTGSNQANKNFLKLGDVRNDPFRKQTLKVMIQNFKEITIRIRTGYNKVLSKILFQNTNASAIVTLATVQPILQKVREEADLMYYKVKQCLEMHDSREFRSLLLKFETFLNASQQIQDIILIVSESKNRIDDLFKNLERQNHLDERVDHERRRGIKKVRNAVRDYGDDCIEAKILDKVQSAINEMADKTLQAYSKINGVRGLMMRIKQCLKQNKDFYDLDDIVKFNKIFKQVLMEAQSYEKFADKFMDEGDIVNDDLRQCILRYREEIEVNKSSVYAMQLKFISNIIQTSVQSFQANYSVCNAVDSNLSEDHAKVNNLLQSVCSCLSDQTTKVNIKSMSRDIDSLYKNVEKLIKKLQRTPKSISIDTHHGLQTLLKFQETVDQFKTNVRQIIQRSERAHKEITKKKLRRQNIEQPDIEQLCIKKTISVSKKLNDLNRKVSIQECKSFKNVKEGSTIPDLASQIGQLKFYAEFKSLLSQIEQINHNNQLGSLVSEFKAQDRIYEISPYFVEVHKLATSTNQSTLLKSLQTITSKYKSNFKEVVNIVQNFMQRVYATTLIRGLDKQMIKKIDNNKTIQFPINQHDVESLRRDAKYLHTICSIMPEVLVKQKVSLTENAMEQLVEGIKITQQVKWNKEGQFYLQSNFIFQIIEDAFQKCFKQKSNIDLDSVSSRMKQIGNNIDKLQKREKQSGYHEARIEKVMNVLNKYEQINNKMRDHIKRVEELEALQCYSQLVFHFTEYLKSTLQSFHATLNKSNNILWLCQYPKQNPKTSSFSKQLGLQNVKNGQYTQKYNEKAKIIARKPKPKPKEKEKEKDKKSGKQKNAPQKNKSQVQIEDDLAEDIEHQVQQGMGEEIDQFEQMDEEMQEDMEEMDDNLVEQMEEDMQEEDMPEEDMAEEMIMEADENIIDDFEDEGFVLKKNPNRPSAARNKQHHTNSPSKKAPESPKKNDKEISKKKEEQKQEEKGKKEAIVIRQKKCMFLFEIFKYVETLEDLQLFITKISNIQDNFWSENDFQAIEVYFNRDSNAEIQKNLLQSLDKFCKTQYPLEFIDSIKNSENYKIILKEIDDLNLLKFAVLSSILIKSKKNYSCLLGVNKQLLRLSIKNSDKWEAKVCVTDFVKKQLTVAKLDFQAFECDGYIDQMIKSVKSYETKYQLGDKNLVLKGEDIKEKVDEFQKLIKSYQDFVEFPDGIDLQLVVQSMWHKCGPSKNKDESENMLKVTDKLNNDIKLLETGQNFNNSVYYLKKLREQGKKTLDQMQTHRKKLKKILEDVNKQNLLQCVANLVKLYKCKPEKIINFEGKPIMFRSDEKKNERKEVTAIRKLLLPSDQKITNLNSQQIRNKLKDNPEIYAQHRGQICSILSLLELQSHIWPAETKLFISQTRDQTLKLIVAHISNNLIKDAHEQLQNLQEINDSLVVVNLEQLIFQYAIKEDKKIMNIQHNSDFYNNYLKVCEQYKTKSNCKLQISDCIFQSLFGLQDLENSVTTQIFDYTQTLSLVLKQRIFTEEWETIFNYHIPTQNKMEQMKKKIDSQVRLLLSIVQQPIQIDLGNKLSSMKQIQNKNKLIVKWYNEHKGKQDKNLKVFKVCLCTDQQCKENTIFYVGQISSKHLEYYKKLTSNSHVYDKYLKKWEKDGVKDGEMWGQAVVLHIGKAIKQMCSKLVETDQQLFTQFINKYNLIHIVKRQQKNKGLSQLYGRLEKLSKNKRQLAESVNLLMESSKKNGALFKILNEIIQGQCHMDLNHIIKNNNEELEKLSEIKIDKTEYSKFGNWVIHIVGKTYKFPFYILVDKENHNDIVCILPANTDQQIKTQLNNLQLPTEFKIAETKNNYKKIHLSNQIFSFKLDENSINKQQLDQLISQNFGIPESDDKQRQTWVLGVYRKTKKDGQDDQYLLSISYIKDELISKGQQIEISINQFETKADIQLKVLEVKWKEGEKIGEDNIIRQIKSQRYTSVNLGDNILATALSRWLAGELKKIKQKKQIEKQQFILQQQKQQEEKEAKLKAQQQQEQRKRKQQQAFILSQQVHSSKTIGQETKNCLKKLYNELIQNSIYTLAEDKIGQDGQPGSRSQLPKTELNSQKNIQIRSQTQKAIIKIENGIMEDEVKHEFQRLADNYLSSIDKLIEQRQKILEQVLKQAKKEEKSLQQQGQGSSLILEHEARLISQMEEMEGYTGQIRYKIRKELKKLAKQKRQLLESVYNNNKNI